MASREDTSGLTPSQLASFRRKGYLIIPNALPPDTISALLSETSRLLTDDLDLSHHPLTRFITGQGDAGKSHTGDNYFLNSGDKVRYFFEEGAFDPATGEINKPKERAVNKIGHGLHFLSEPFSRLFVMNPARKEYISDMKARPADVVRSLGYKDPRCLQSMVICKQPEIGGAVPPHQDSCFLYTEPPSAVGFWYALEDATLENGCLRFAAGSHRRVGITRRLVRGGKGGTEMVNMEGEPRFPRGEEAEERRDAEEVYVPEEVKAGSLVLIHGSLLHKSERNTSEKGRTAYTFHVIEGAAEWTYDERNWLQPPEGGFTKVYT